MSDRVRKERENVRLNCVFYVTQENADVCLHVFVELHIIALALIRDGQCKYVAHNGEE